MAGAGGRHLEWRRLTRAEIGLLWTIDRREIVERTYALEGRDLVLKDDYHDIRGWPPGDEEHSMPWLEASFDRGAVFLGVFDKPRLVGAAVVDTVLLGPQHDLVQLSFLHVGRDERRRGLGTELFHAAGSIARDLGASGLYVSATPSENTVGFYLRRGCVVTPGPDPELFAREPEDVHFECRFGPQGLVRHRRMWPDSPAGRSGAGADESPDRPQPGTLSV